MKGLWYPPEELVENSNVKKFMDKHGFRDYNSLIRKSAADIEWFWSKAVEELGVEWFRPPEAVLDASRGIQWARWFPGGEINVAHNALDRHARSHARDRVAFIWAGEDGAVERCTYRDLYVRANKLANALAGLGVRRGDAVALLLPMVPETIVSMFAILKLGAVVMPIFSGFGPSAIAERLGDSGAKILITVDGIYRRGRVGISPGSAPPSRSIPSTRPSSSTPPEPRAGRRGRSSPTSAPSSSPRRRSTSTWT